MKDEFTDHRGYLESINTAIHALGQDPSVIFLDPDTSLELGGHVHNQTHVLEAEIREIWSFIRPKDVLVLYQHQDNRAGREWIQRERRQFAEALGFNGQMSNMVKGAYAPDIANDVAFYFVQKS